MAQSETIAKLAGALLKAQASFKPLEKASTNPFFKSRYANLDAVIESTREALAENGLCVTQMVEGMALRTVILHESGEWIDGSYPLTPGKADPQGLGAAVTYARRYALQAAVGVCAEDDDDGEGLRQRGASQPPQGRPVERREPSLDEEEMSESAAPRGEGGFKVQSVSVKAQGTSKTGKPYTIFEVEFGGGLKATTFDSGVAEMAKKAFVGDQRVECILEKGPKYDKYKVYDLKSMKVI